MNVTVQTKTGKVQGFEAGEVNAWLGIPFAKPPVGALRFKRAQPVEPWDGVKDCTDYGNVPIQCINTPVNPGKENEDCLNLNIWSPKGADKLPVMVWIYGGGLHYGFNSDPSYDGAKMAASGIVRVNINFRIGIFGYYNFNQYNAELFDTNCALSDQITALRWIKENIAAFGGAPDNITIAGESGGGMAVYHLLASPAAKGLFNKAIAQSGLPGLGGGTQFQRRIISVFLEDYLGVQPNDIATIKTMETATLKKASGKFFAEFSKKYAGIFMPSPVFGDDLLPERPWLALQKGSAKGIDVIFGYNRDEGDTMVAGMAGTAPPWIPSWETVQAMLKNNGKEQLYDELQAAYNQSGNDMAALSAFAKDYFFALDTHRCADEQIKHGSVWMYRFDFVPVAYKQMNMGAVHSVEIPFALDTTNKGFFARYAFKGTPQEQLDAIRDQMNGTWLNFIKTGSPERGAINWQRHDREHNMAHIFNLEPSNQQLSINQRIKSVWEKIGFLYDEE